MKENHSIPPSLLSESSRELIEQMRNRISSYHKTAQDTGEPINRMKDPELQRLAQQYKKTLAVTVGKANIPGTPQSSARPLGPEDLGKHVQGYQGYLEDFLKQDEKKEDFKIDFSQLRKEVLNQKNKGSSLRSDLELFQKYAASKSNPFRKLGLYNSLPEVYYNSQPDLALKPPQKRMYGIHHNRHYCEQVDLYNLLHQDNILKKPKFVSDYNGTGKSY